MVEFRVGRDIDAVQLVSRVERSYMGPHVGTLAEVVLAVGALESLRRPALVLEVAYHVATVFVAARTIGAGMSSIFLAGSSPTGVATRRPSAFSRQFWKTGKIFQRLVAKGGNRGRTQALERDTFFLV